MSGTIVWRNYPEAVEATDDLFVVQVDLSVEYIRGTKPGEPLTGQWVPRVPHEEWGVLGSKGTLEEAIVIAEEYERIFKEKGLEKVNIRIKRYNTP